ncbi:MAG: SpoIIE family protein phosphatase [Leptospiraceae bacterium]|nr:SpoIIE family protein phosphatase [Leptospiraceae bacterium]
MKGERLQETLLNYLDAFLPETHPVMNDLAARRKLRIIMGVGAVVVAIFTTRIPVIYGHTPRIALLVGGMCLFYVLALVFIVRSRARYYMETGFAMVMVATFLIVFNSYIVGTYPPINIPYIVVMVILLHFLYGRWTALIVLVLQWLAHFPFLFEDEIPGFRGVQMGQDVPYFRFRHYVNVLVAGILVWLISEAYDRFRNESESKLQRLQSLHEQELDFARTLQQELLPRDTGAGPYRYLGMMRPAVQVGGDYFDVLNTKKHTWFAVGDVTGHGVQAGLLVMQVRSLLHYCLNVQNMERPSHALIQINNQFFDSVKRLFQRSFMTFVLLRMDSGGNVVYAGSHLRILVFRKDTGKLESYTTQGFWLGVNRLEVGRERNLESRFKLNRGDLVFLYTDGFTEARNARGAYFGLEGLFRAVSLAIGRNSEDLESIHTSIMDEFHRFMGDREPDDDLTLLTIRRSV